MYFRLALALGWPSVAWGLERISSRELSEWAAFFEVDGPPGDPRTEIGLAMLASVIANVNRGKGHRAWQPRDFMMFQKADEADGVDRPQQPAAGLAEYARMLQRKLGGTLKFGE